MPVIMLKEKLFMACFAVAANEQFRYSRYFQAGALGDNPRVEFSKGFFEVAAAMSPKPQTVALVGADAEYGALSLEGARENAKSAGIRIVYDKSYPPSNHDFGPVVRSIKATGPDLLYIASYPTDSVGLVRAIHEVGFSARMVGGGMVGLQFSTLKQQLGALLNNIVYYEFYVPEPTMDFPGIKAFLEKYRARAEQAGVDPLGFYIPPFSYALLQVLEQAITATNSLDDRRLADYIHASHFQTVVGEIKYGEMGEWAMPRLLTVQYHNIVGNDIDQFRQSGKQVILQPSIYKSGDLVSPFAPIVR